MTRAELIRRITVKVMQERSAPKSADTMTLPQWEQWLGELIDKLDTTVWWLERYSGE